MRSFCIYYTFGERSITKLPRNPEKPTRAGQIGNKYFQHSQPLGSEYKTRCELKQLNPQGGVPENLSKSFWVWWLIWISGRCSLFFLVQGPSRKVWLSDNVICVSVLHLHQQTICAKVIKQKKDKWSVAQKRLNNNDNIIILHIPATIITYDIIISFSPCHDQQH